MKTQLIAAALLFTGFAAAAPITSTEPPDLPGTGGPIFEVGIGTNTVSGFVNGTPFGGDYQDNFSISVPANLVVTSTSVSITSFSGNGGLGCFTGAGCFGTGLFSGLNNPASGTTVSYTATSPWANSPGGGVDVGAFSYTLTLQVTASTLPPAEVPEPGTLPLLASGVAAVVLWSRGRQSRS